jgi:hypothetical protein
VQGQAVPVLVHHHLRHQLRAQLPARHHLVSYRGAHHLGLALTTRKLLPPVHTDDDFGGDQLEHFGDVMTDALTQGATHGTGTLSLGYRNEVVDAP